MPDIAENIASLKNELPQGVKLVAVSKTKPVSDILVAYKSGHRIFGENIGYRSFFQKKTFYLLILNGI